MKNYWRPHFVVAALDNGDETSYRIAGIKEVHYENNVPVMWSENFITVTSIEETYEDALEQSMSLLELYHSAKENAVYEEYTENGRSKLRLFNEYYKYD